MGTLKVTIPDDLEKEFREEIFKSKGMKKGNISKAVEEAIRLWIEHQRKKRSEAAKKAWETRRKKQQKALNEDLAENSTGKGQKR